MHRNKPTKCKINVNLCYILEEIRYENNWSKKATGIKTRKSFFYNLLLVQIGYEPYCQPSTAVTGK